MLLLHFLLFLSETLFDLIEMLERLTLHSQISLAHFALHILKSFTIVFEKSAIPSFNFFKQHVRFAVGFGIFHLALR